MNQTRVSTQLRLSVAGGGTDLPEYYERHGAELLAAGLDFRVTLTVRLRDDGWLTFNGGDPVLVDTDDSLCGAVLRRCHPRGADIVCSSTISAGTGLGGSGAFSTALVAALRDLKGQPIDRLDVALEAFRIEREDFGAPVGMQDHVAAVFGGMVRMKISLQGRCEVVDEPRLFENLTRLCDEHALLMDTGVQRAAGQVLENLKISLKNDNSGASRYLSKNASLAERIELAIAESSVGDLGAALHEHWENKRRTNSAVSSEAVDQLYQEGQRMGVLGGKLVGAGGGGFLFLVCRPGRRDAVRQHLSSLGLREQKFSTLKRGLRIERPVESISPSLFSMANPGAIA